MLRRMCGVVGFVLLLSLAGAGQEFGGYLDTFIVKVKPEKRAEFDQIVKKLVDANRNNSGDTWLAAETTYGEGNTVYFTSRRKNFAEVDRGFEVFVTALNKAYGEAGAEEILQDLNNCTLSSRSEMRRRRPDLSPNLPTDMAAYNKLVGEARWYRTTIIRVRPGRTAEYEAQIKILKDAVEKADKSLFVAVAESAAGTQGAVYYATILRSSLAGFDSSFTVKQALGDEAYQKYLQVMAETVLSTETIINRFLPRLSNAPEEIASVAPEFWNPKAAPKPTSAP